MSLDELEAQYASDLSEKDRASLEAQIWSLIPKDVRAVHHGCAGYMNAKFGTGHYKAKARQYLHLAGAAADPLWDRIANDMTLRSAILIMKVASKRKAELGEDLASAVRAAIVEYDDSGYATHLPSGKVVRRRKVGDSMEPPASSPPEGRAFWPFIRSHIMQYIRSRLPDADQHTRDSIIRKFEVDLNVLISDFQKELSKAPKHGLTPGVMISRRAVVQACRVLNMNPPRVDQPVDMQYANLQRKRHARAYHPDAHGGSEKTRAQYQAVMEAYKLLESYNENLGGTDVPIVAGSSPTNGEDHGQ